MCEEFMRCVCARNGLNTVIFIVHYLFSKYRLDINVMGPWRSFSYVLSILNELLHKGGAIEFHRIVSWSLNFSVII